MIFRTYVICNRKFKNTSSVKTLKAQAQRIGSLEGDCREQEDAGNSHFSAGARRGTSGLHFLFGAISQAETRSSYFWEANKSTERTEREFSDSPAEPSNPEMKARRQSHGAMYSLWKTQRTRNWTPSSPEMVPTCSGPC